MATCFVIQPFDNGKYDKRYRDCFAPAITKAGLEPYRVDRDPAADVLIASIEDGIRNAALCLAEISTDNANVWYELGYAMALGKPVVMVCAQGRSGFPFDIRHRKVIEYGSEAPSDFDALKDQIVATIEARLSGQEMLKQAAASDMVADQQGLSHAEIVVIAAIAAEAALPSAPTALAYIRRNAEQQGVTSIGTQLAVRRLSERCFISVGEEDGLNESYPTVALTDDAWRWIDANDALFVLSKSPPAEVRRRRAPPPPDDFVDDIPF